MTKKKRRSFRHKVTLFVKTSTGLKVVLFFSAIILLSSLVVFAIERKTNEGFVTFFDSLWWTIVTISTVGYGDRLPLSLTGRIIAIITIFVGMGIMGTVTGRIASFLMERQMKEERGLLDYSTMKGHFVVCGWKREMNRVLHEILKSNPDLSPLEIVLINSATRDQINTLRKDTELKGLKFVSGNFFEELEMIRAGVKGAARVLVLADYLTEGDMQQVDSKTVMTVMTIKNLNKKAYVCAELLDTKFEKYLKLSHCDEILLAREFSRSMLASASSGTGLSHVVRSLISGESGADITTASYPNSFVGRTFQELRTYYYTKHNAQLIGMLENTGNLLVRKREALKEAQMNPDISKLIPDLRSVKTISANDPIINPPRDYIVNKYSRAIIITNPVSIS